MNLPDTNIWLALVLSKHEYHVAAGNWFAAQRRNASVLFCRSTQQSFLRLLTTEGLMRLYDLPAFSNAEAWRVMEGFLADSRIAWAAEPSGVEALWKNLSIRSTSSPKLWMDAYLAAFAMAGHHQLVTNDAAFAQHAKLDVLVLPKA